MLAEEVRLGTGGLKRRGDDLLVSSSAMRQLLRLALRAASPETIPALGVEGSTAVLLTADGRALFALGTGGLTSGGRRDAVRARIRIALWWAVSITQMKLIRHREVAIPA